MDAFWELGLLTLPSLYILEMCGSSPEQNNGRQRLHCHRFAAGPAERLATSSEKFKSAETFLTVTKRSYYYNAEILF